MAAVRRRVWHDARGIGTPRPSLRTVHRRRDVLGGERRRGVLARTDLRCERDRVAAADVDATARVRGMPCGQLVQRRRGGHALCRGVCRGRGDGRVRGVPARPLRWRGERLVQRVWHGSLCVCFAHGVCGGVRVVEDVRRRQRRSGASHIFERPRVRDVYVFRGKWRRHVLRDRRRRAVRSFDDVRARRVGVSEADADVGSRVFYASCFVSREPVYVCGADGHERSRVPRREAVQYRDGV